MTADRHPPAAGSLLFGVAPSGGHPAGYLAALRKLSGGRPFLLHVYAAWRDGDGTDPRWLAPLLGSLSEWGKEGFLVELVVRYESQAGDVGGYARFLARLVGRLSREPAVVHLQVTNEADSPLDRAASDGGFPGAVQALVEGVESAARAARAERSFIQVGFNVAYPITISELDGFFSTLGRLGGASFARDVGFVGLDLYPGTYFPALPAPFPSQSFVPASAGLVSQTLLAFRRQVLPAAGIGSGTKIELTEIGFATSTRWGHSDAEQAELVRALAAGACAVRREAGISAFEWYDLADAAAPSDSLSPIGLGLPWRFGLMTYQMSPKPAFQAYRAVIANGCR